MTTHDVILVLAIFAFVMITQVGHKTFNLRKALLPLLVVGGVGASYLKGAPGGPGNLLLEGSLAGLGVIFGLIALSLVRVGRNPDGTFTTIAGVGYVAVWVVAFGGRLLFGYGSQHWFAVPIGQFMATYHLSPAVWAPAFVLMAVTMIATRSIGLLARTRHGADVSEGRQAVTSGSAA